MMSEAEIKEAQADGTGIGEGNKTLEQLNLSANQVSDGIDDLAARMSEYLQKGELKVFKELLLQRNGLSEEQAGLFAGADFEQISVRT